MTTLPKSIVLIFLCTHTFCPIFLQALEFSPVFSGTRLGDFYKVIGKKNSYIRGQNIWWLLWPFYSIIFKLKTTMSTFWATFGEIGSLFIQTSGHSVLECAQQRAGHRRSNQSFVYSSAFYFLLFASIPIRPSKSFFPVFFYFFPNLYKIFWIFENQIFCRYFYDI